MSERSALELRGLTVGYLQPGDSVNTVVWDVDLRLEPGRIVGLAGESGCGKSTTALAAIGYRGGGTRILAGSSVVDGTDLLALPTNRLRSFWGRRVAYVPQGASSALSPAMTVGAQLAEPLSHHLGLRGDALRRRQLELFEQVGLPSPETALKRYPHQFSGGQQQRIALALALSCNPAVLVLDEPTTGLDVTTQARISQLLKRLVAEFETAALYVSHDLTLLGEIADRVAVMYGGQIVEEGPAPVVVGRPSHPYTHALISAVPDAARPRALSGIPGRPPASVVEHECPFAPRCQYVIDACRTANPPIVQVGSDHRARCIRVADVKATPLPATPITLSTPSVEAPLLEVEEIWCEYRSGAGRVAVVKGVSFHIAPSETVGIVGESGSGKSTLLRAIAGLHRPSAGSIRLMGEELAPLAVKRSRETRRTMQIVFQNPDTSLNPRQTVMQIVARPLQLFRSDIPRAREGDEVRRLLEAVKLPGTLLYRYPGELSGGQKQRVALARAFASNPSLLLCDEVTSALDVSVQATILELIAELSAEFNTAVAFVSHDLAVVRTVAHRALVMQEGVVCETGETGELFAHPSHPYTRDLILSIPSLAVVGEKATLSELRREPDYSA
jgi:peptide/nickel transport system ATP-binding protein